MVSGWDWMKETDIDWELNSSTVESKKLLQLIWFYTHDGLEKKLKKEEKLY